MSEHSRGPSGLRCTLYHLLASSWHLRHLWVVICSARCRRCMIQGREAASDPFSQVHTIHRRYKVKFKVLSVHIYIKKGCVWFKGKGTRRLSPGRCNTTPSPKGYFFFFSFPSTKDPFWSDQITPWKLHENDHTVVPDSLQSYSLLKNQHCQLQNCLIRLNQSWMAHFYTVYFGNQFREAPWEENCSRP